MQVKDNDCGRSISVGKGGGSNIHIFEFTDLEKEIDSAEYDYMNIAFPPPPLIDRKEGT